MEFPDEKALLGLMKETGYSMMQENGQRKYGGPPPDWEGPPPGRGCEVFVGKLPRDVYEDELVPVFELAGKIYELRLMMEFSGENRGYAFVMFTTREMAQKAIQLLDNFEIRPGRFIGVCVSLDNCRLFIGSLPKDKTKEEIIEEMKKVTQGVVDVVVYPMATDKSQNRGYAFVEYESHKAAAMGRRKLIPETVHLWGNNIQVDWAEPVKDIDEETMQHVRTLYVRNLSPTTSEGTIWQEFSQVRPGSVAHVKKRTRYAFVHYHSRQDALAALHLMDGALVDGVPVQVTFAKPGAGAAGGRRSGGRGGGRHSSGAQGAAGGGRNGILVLQREDGGMELESGCPRPLSLGNPIHLGAGRGAGDSGQCVFPVAPETSLSPISLLALKPSQMSSAVVLLEQYCLLNSWSLPEYYLFSSPGQGGGLMLIYKVVISSTRSSYMPDNLCTLVEDAKEEAARNALWNIDGSWMVQSTLGSPGSLPLLGPSGSGAGLLTHGGRALSPYHTHPLSPLSPPFPAMSPLSPKLYVQPQSPLY